MNWNKNVQDLKNFGWNKCQIPKLPRLWGKKILFWFPLWAHNTYSLPWLSSPLKVQEQISTPGARESRGCQMGEVYTYNSQDLLAETLSPCQHYPAKMTPLRPAQRPLYSSLICTAWANTTAIKYTLSVCSACSAWKVYWARVATVAS